MSPLDEHHTDSVKIEPAGHDPIAATLTAADDRIELTHWLPPQQGVVPQIRFGRRWYSTLWALPLGAAGLVILIAVAQSVRELPSVRQFIAHYPGSPRRRRRSTPDSPGGCSCSTR